MKSRLVLLTAVVAVGALLAAPFALGDDEPSPPSAPHTAAPAVTPAGHDMLVSDHQRADLDGDGRTDDVRLLRDSAGEEPAEGAVEVTLAAGGKAAAPVPLGYFDELKPALDLNGDGREQVMLEHTGGGDASQLLVYGWNDGRLVRLAPDPRAPLGSEMVEGLPGVGYYLENGRLLTWRRTGSFGPEQPTSTVDVWSWAVEADRLIATPAGQRCLDLMTEHQPHACS